MNTLFVYQMIQDTLFYGIYRDSHNMILGQLKIGEHKATCGGLPPCTDLTLPRTNQWHPILADFPAVFF